MSLRISLSYDTSHCEVGHNFCMQCNRHEMMKCGRQQSILYWQTGKFIMNSNFVSIYVNVNLSSSHVPNFDSALVPWTWKVLRYFTIKMIHHHHHDQGWKKLWFFVDLNQIFLFKSDFFLMYDWFRKMFNWFLWYKLTRTCAQLRCRKCDWLLLACFHRITTAGSRRKLPSCSC